MSLGEQKRCMGCMNLLSWDGRCLKCRFEESEYSSDVHHLPLGTLLKNGEYMVGKVLGSGGFGITYMGFDQNLLSRVAIKEYYPARYVSRNVADGDYSVRVYSEDAKKEYEKGLKAFIEESRILAKFSGMQGIVSIRGFFQENETAYIVMECVEGISVKEYVQRQGRIQPELVLEMMQQPIQALQKVHEEMLVHRDVSADNFIIDSYGRLTLIDFGAARYSNVMDDRTNTTICKQGFSAIEQYSGSGKQGPWTDVYSICATMYYMMTGIIPKSSTDRIIDDTIISLVQMDEIQLDQRKKQVIMDGMTVKNSERIQNMQELYLQLYGNPLARKISVASEEIQERVSQQTFRKSTFSPTALLGELTQAAAARKRRARRKKMAKFAIAVMAALLVVLFFGKAKEYIGFERTIAKWRLESIASVNTPEPANSLEHEELLKQEKYENDLLQDAMTQEKKQEDNNAEPTMTPEKEIQKESTVRMPKVSGLKKATAISRLKKSGLRYKIVYRYSSSIKKGKVIRANVTEGKMLKKEKSIILYVSKGKKKTVVRTTSEPRVTPAPNAPLLSVPEEVQETNKKEKDDSMAGDIDSILN